MKTLRWLAAAIGLGAVASPAAANPPFPHPALWAGPVYVEPAPGAAGTAGQAPPEPGYGDLAWILERLLAGRRGLRW